MTSVATGRMPVLIGLIDWIARLVGEEERRAG
jgi:hypothetical protein